MCGPDSDERRPTDAQLIRARPGVVVGRTEPARGTRREIVFDPATGRLLRLRETVVDPLVAFGGPTCGPGQSCPSTNPTCEPGQPGLNTSPLLCDLHAGAVLGDSVLTAAVVDRAGQRPAR